MKIYLLCLFLIASGTESHSQTAGVVDTTARLAVVHVKRIISCGKCLRDQVRFVDSLGTVSQALYVHDSKSNLDRRIHVESLNEEVKPTNPVRSLNRLAASLSKMIADSVAATDPPISTALFVVIDSNIVAFYRYEDLFGDSEIAASRRSQLAERIRKGLRGSRE